jgi:hypothetical protein
MTGDPVVSGAALQNQMKNPPINELGVQVREFFCLITPDVFDLGQEPYCGRIVKDNKEFGSLWNVQEYVVFLSNLFEMLANFDTAARFVKLISTIARTHPILTKQQTNLQTLLKQFNLIIAGTDADLSPEHIEELRRSYDAQIRDI